MINKDIIQQFKEIINYDFNVNKRILCFRGFLPNNEGDIPTYVFILTTDDAI